MLSMRSSLLALILILGADLLPAQQSPATRAAAALSPDVLRGHLEFLSDDALEGRAPGTRGGELAQKYLASQLRRLGLAPSRSRSGTRRLATGQLSSLLHALVAELVDAPG